MQKKQTRGVVERKFSRIETWEEFLTKWEAVETEEEAVGLLYGGANVFPFGPDKGFDIDSKGDIVKERIAFYLDCARCSNETIATVAQQIIIKSWLKRVIVSWVGYFSGYLEATNMVLEFLQNPSEAILKPPYPRFVAEWLLPLHEEWRYGTHSTYRTGKSYLALQDLTKLIVKVLCVWGLGYVLARDGLRPETIPMIKEFLDEQGYEPGKIFMEISGYGDAPSDLSSSEGKKNVGYIAACAFLKLKFWVGGGFTANFVRSIPPQYLAE